jgi:phosphopantothenoylcysteine decarboxylase / phosphopantothenate---cysteine ligase
LSFSPPPPTTVLVAPTMHGSLHNRILVESLQRLHALGVRVVPPRDAYGKHNLPDEGVLVAEVARAVSRSKLKGRRILVTGGTTPVPIDGVRRIVNRFRGRLGIALAAELHLRGAEVLLVHGGGALPVPSFVPHRVARTYDDHRAIVGEELGRGYEAGVFSAGVADYRPALAAEGKIPSGQATLSLTLVPTVKVIEEVRQAHPDLYMVTFKYQEGLSHEALIEIARGRLDRFPCVIANRGEEQTARQQRAWMVTRGAEPRALDGKRAIAEAVADHLETALGRPTAALHEASP